LGVIHDQQEPNLVFTLARENKNLVKCIGFEVTTIDQIIVRSGLSVEKVVCDIAELELQGIVRAVPGGYTRC
jgi:DNA processing protein